LVNFYPRKMNREEKGISMCPTQEDIAAFLDDKLNDSEKDVIMGHLSACTDCREVFVAAINIQEELASAKSNLPPRKILFKIISYSSAAAAAILITFFIARGVSMSKLSFVEHRIASLAKEIDKDSIPSLSIREPSAVYGFADSYAVNSEAFRVGVCLTKLEITMMLEDKENAIRLIDETIRLLKGIQGADKSIESCTSIKKEIGEGISMRKLASQIEKTASDFKDPLHVYVRFGQWCEGGRIAAFHKTEKFFDPEDVKAFIKKLENENMPKGVSLSLQEIKKILGEGIYSERQFRKLEKEYENLILLI